jgi:glutathione-specific gamma-glutamylcyclotransferase
MSVHLRKNGSDSGEMALTPDLVARLQVPPVDCGPGPNDTLCEEADYGRLLSDVLSGKPPGDVWLFAYGSLMWRPACLDAERRPALLRGHHRQFCLWVRRFRGTPERPGLMLALERGGQCQGLAIRLQAKTMEQDLDKVLRREIIMKPSAYLPRWLKLQTAAGPLMALGFVINRDCPRYTGELPEPHTARILAGAVGHIGSGAEYLMHTVAHLEELGLRDRLLWRLQALVAKELSGAST